MIASVSQIVDRVASTVGALALLAALPVAGGMLIAQSLA
jgi:hypothetical protein